MKLEIQGKSLFQKDIELFDSKNKLNTKDNNDKNNKIREQIIYAVINNYIPDEWYKDKNWSNFKKVFMTYVSEFENFYKNVNCIIKGGRKNNSDFIFTYTLEDDSVKDHIVEFKFNTISAMKCPQILSLASNECNYAELFYDKYLPKITCLYGINHLLPDKETYLRNVYQADYKKLKIFQYLYDNENKNIRAKESIVNKSIHDFLLSEPEISYEYFENKLRASQLEKNYLCYYKGAIYRDKIKPKELQITSHRLKSPIKGYHNTIILYTQTNTELHMLLRWKNHKGVLFPAWQISIYRYDENINYSPYIKRLFKSKY
jgi:hypothetical protein